MPRAGYEPVTVHEVTAEAVRETRDEFEDYASYDDVVRDSMIQLNAANGHLPEELAEALEGGDRLLEEDG